MCGWRCVGKTSLWCGIGRWLLAESRRWIRCTGSRIWSTGWRVGRTGCRIRRTGRRVCVTGCRVSRSGCRIGRTGCRISRIGCRIWSTGGRVRLTLFDSIGSHLHIAGCIQITRLETKRSILQRKAHFPREVDQGGFTNY